MKQLLVSVGLILSIGLHAQVTIDPPFPNINSSITVYFDATKGNQGLKDCNCTVYAHAGLITDKSSSGSDWKYVIGNWGTDDSRVKMNKVSDNLYSLTYNIKSFYGIPESTVIRKLAFVFRNLNGSKEGKTESNGDIYYDFPDPNAGLQYLIQSPSLESRLVSKNSVLNLSVLTSIPADLRFTINGQDVVTTHDVSMSYQYIADQVGTFRFEIGIHAGNEGLDTSFVWTVGGDPEISEVLDGLLLGCNKVEEGKAIVLLEAPRRNIAFLVGNFSNWAPLPEYQMKQSPDGQFLWGEIDTVGLQGDLDYQIWFGDGLKIPDPLSVEILDDVNDKYIPAAVYPDMPSYPEGKTTGLVSHLKLNADYDWQDEAFVKPAVGDLVIYELLVRDFLASHDFDDLIDTLLYLKRLGVNAIELMPVSEFEGNISWGYNVSLHNAIDKYYGGASKLKKFVDAAHGLGFAVIADVVFNHAFGQNPMVRMYWNAAQNKPAIDNPWFNPDAKHPFNVGYDFNHQSAATRRYVSQILREWIREYHFDGYRFDLSKGFTQVNNPNDVGAWGQYDPSRIEILKYYSDQIREVDPQAYVILEHFADNQEEKELSDYGMMLWGNINYEYAESVKGNSASLNRSYFRQRGWRKPHLVSYMESHDEERVMYKALKEGRQSAGYNVRDLNTALGRVGMAAAFFYTIPGPKMLWQFGETGYDYSINHCPDGTVNNNCRVDPKPIRWDYYHQQNRLELFAVTAGLTHLKHSFPDLFDDVEIDYDLNGLFKYIVMDQNDLKMVVIGNFDVTDGSKAITFPTDEWYYNYMGRDSIKGNTSPRQITLKQGEYKVYLNKKVENPGITLSDKGTLIQDVEFTVYPNPAESELHIQLPERIFYETVSVTVSDISGRIVYHDNRLSGQTTITIPLNSVKPGVYLVRVSNPSVFGVKKVMIVR